MDVGRVTVFEVFPFFCTLETWRVGVRGRSKKPKVTYTLKFYKPLGVLFHANEICPLCLK